MPSVVTYWQSVEDETDFFRFLQSTGDVLALPANWMETKEVFVPQHVEPFVNRYDPDQLLLTQEGNGFLWEIERRQFDRDIRFGIPIMTSCVFAYRRGKFRNGKLAQSNISAYLDYPTEDKSSLVAKPDQFVLWVKKVIGWIRKATPERIECNGYPYRATRRVKTSVLDGKLDVALY
jgi:hypothetical protein